VAGRSFRAAYHNPNGGIPIKPLFARAAKQPDEQLRGFNSVDCRHDLSEKGDYL
jgi:hypothetical protein